MPRDKMAIYDYMDEFPNCEVSGGWCGDSQPHHIRSVGSGGLDISCNLIRLTKKLHREIHMTGGVAFCKKYKVYKIKKVLEERGQWNEEDEEDFGA